MTNDIQYKKSTGYIKNILQFSYTKTVFRPQKI